MEENKDWRKIGPYRPIIPNGELLIESVKTYENEKRYDSAEKC